MVSVGRDEIGATQTKHYGIDLDGPDGYLTAVDGTTTTISGTPTVSGINCTVAYLTNSGGIVYIRVSAGAGVGARGEAQVTSTLANGEVVPLKIDLDFV